MNDPKPFSSAEEAWFWTCQAIKVRQGHAEASGQSASVRPCAPEDVLKEIDAMYRRRKINAQHAWVMRHWGNIGTAPDASVARLRGASVLWRQAITALDEKLRLKGIVA